MHFVQTIFVFVISLSFSRGNVIVRLWKRDIFRGNGRGQEEEKASFMLHFKNIVIINVA